MIDAEALTRDLGALVEGKRRAEKWIVEGSVMEEGTNVQCQSTRRAWTNETPR